MKDKKITLHFIILLAIGLFAGQTVLSQSVGINVSSVSPSVNAILDLNTGNSGTLGIIIPNKSLIALGTFGMAQAATAGDIGMMIYNTNPLVGNGVGYYYWSGTAWTCLTGTGNAASCASAATNYIPIFTSPTALCNSIIYQSGTSLGINTTTPLNALDVAGAVAIGSYAGTNTAPAGTSIIASGQVGVGTNSPNASALLDLTSTTQGLLPPRMSTAQIAAIASPAVGLVVYNSITDCYEYNYSGSSSGWVDIACPCSGAPTTVVPTGNTSPSVSTTYTYTCPASTGATTYSWSVSSTNATITSGNGTQTVTVAFNSTSTSLNICVSAINACGSSQGCLAVSDCGTITHSSQTFNWNGSSDYYNGSLQTWTVPACVTNITITAVGGQGGGTTSYTTVPGSGASITGTATVTPGDQIEILVGGQGGKCTVNDGGGGGGGSFVWDTTSGVLLAVAGGGGGVGAIAGAVGEPGANGQTNTATLTTPTNGTGADGNAAGGTNGGTSSGGGAGTTTADGAACGGAGWRENGINIGAGTYSYTGYGYRPENGAATAGQGGAPYNTTFAAYGGYGGGGGGGFNGGGGGGGYNGGGGGNASDVSTWHGGGGGGGGSYFNGTVTSTTTSTGNGSVTIYW